MQGDNGLNDWTAETLEREGQWRFALAPPVPERPAADRVWSSVRATIDSLQGAAA